jgi:hypothetical protein
VSPDHEQESHREHIPHLVTITTIHRWSSRPADETRYCSHPASLTGFRLITVPFTMIQ